MNVNTWNVIEDALGRLMDHVETGDAEPWLNYAGTDLQDESTYRTILGAALDMATKNADAINEATSTDERAKVMKTEPEIRAEIARIGAILNRPGRRPKYAVHHLTTRIETLRWTVGEETIFDDEPQS